MTIEQDNFASTAGAASAAFDAGAKSAPKSFSWSSRNRPAGLSRNATSACLTKSSEALTEALKNLPVDPATKIALIKVDNAQETHLRASGMVVVAYPADKNDKRAAFYTLVLEGSTEPIPSRTENIGGVNVVIDYYGESIFDGHYMETVEALVTSALPGYSLYPNSGTVVPRDFNWADTDAVRNVLISGGLAAANGLDLTSADWHEINAAYANRAEALQITPGFHQQSLADYVGQPVYTDVRLGLDAVSMEKPATDTVNTKDRSTSVARIGGFIDLVWAGDQFGGQNQFMLQQGPKPKFAARFVATALENTLTYSIGSQLLALAALHQLGEGTNWFPAFLPQPGAANHGPIKGYDLKDIGAINIEANINNEPGAYGSVFDTKSSNVTPLDIGKLLVASVIPGLSIALDVSRCGTDTWYNEVFAAAASSHTYAADAQRAILEAADTLTNGAFGQLYTTNEAPVIQDNEVVLLGYFDGQDGQRHDLREITYLAAANMVGRTDPAFLAAFSDTYLRSDIALERRLMDRKNMIRTLVPSVVFTGTAQRVTVRNTFMEALVKGLVQCNTVFKLASANNVEFSATRGYASWLDQARLNPQASGLFQPGYTPRQQAAFGGRNFANRWG